ncbi:YciI family protein [Psychroflexus sp. CAK57W]|uniref:YciI-like protein n=1 Tax=Psychroflexus curvus TaxID=2873595 RepID=UPI001CCD5961|nr:YciI-like protein [Psychroflexus curvus]MBZ9627847.1 YciI family protein [Psychroflexus curvus]MBZ9787523.1 YciI family protein [Psychroflexus curvus]
MHYILFYKSVDNYIEKRAPFRQEHLELLKTANEQGTLVMAGAFSEPADGGVFIFKTNDPSVAENFAKNDPYVKNGLITEWKIRPWTVVIGG